MVYRALDPRLERQVAIKLLPEETARNPQSRERLRREAMAVAAIDHPYMCKIFEIGEHGDALFLVMEYIAGQTLADKLRAGRLPLPEALRLAGEIAEALQEAHGRRFLHRDLKAANVMVTDRKARYASAAEVRADLATLLSNSGSGDALNAGAITSAVTSSSSAVPSPATPAAEMASSRPRTRTWWMAGVAVLGIGIASYLLAGWQRQRPAATAGSIRSIAVLPLDNYSGDASQDYFAEGMTDEITADLATISQLRVISRGSAMQFKAKERPPTPEIGRRLNVDAVIEGSVSRSGERVRITAQLIDAREDKHLWAETFERSSRDVLSLQAELAGAIARAIDVRLTPTERSRLTTPKAVNPEAHDAYLRGRFFFNRPSDDNLQNS